MRLKLVTEVEASMEVVIKGFNKSLFDKLNPPFPKATVKQFDGSEVGDIVSIELDFLLFKQNWVSKITHCESSSDHYEFVDEGITLPFFLKAWKHRHIIRKVGQSCQIEDNVSFSSTNQVTTYLFFPFLYLLFLYRKPIYTRIFRA